MSDYAVKITIKNGRILSRMRARGIESLAELARRAGIKYQTLIEIVALKKRPIGKRGKWLEGLENVAGVLKCDVEDLFSDAQREMALERNSGGSLPRRARSDGTYGWQSGAGLLD